MEVFDQLNYLAIVVALTANVAISMAWYSKALFGKAWMAHLGLTDEAIAQQGMGTPLAISLVANFVYALTIAIVSARTGEPGLLHGLKVGLVLGVGVGAASMLPHYAFQGRKTGLMLIDAAHTSACGVAMGAIIGAWP